MHFQRLHFDDRRMSRFDRRHGSVMALVARPTHQPDVGHDLAVLGTLDEYTFFDRRDVARTNQRLQVITDVDD
jgi:hypothetical protein